MEELFAWLQRSEGPLGYFVLAVASAVEYVFPPFPGDAIALFGVVLAASAGYDIVAVYVALTVGALGGEMAAYWAGRWIAVRREHRTPRFLRGQQARRAIDKAIARFERHGVAYLAINRFVPVLRAVVFVAAGMAKLPPAKVAGWGTLSAMMWNGLLIALGFAVGANYAELERWVSTYSHAALGALALVVAAIGLRALWSRRKSRAKQPEDAASEDAKTEEPTRET